MRGRSHSREFKLEIVRQLASGEKRPAQVCREHNLAASMVAGFRQEYEAKVAELERFCGQLAMENAVLKRALRQLPSRNGMQ
jgi:transposase